MHLSKQYPPIPNALESLAMELCRVTFKELLSWRNSPHAPGEQTRYERAIHFAYKVNKAQLIARDDVRQSLEELHELPLSKRVAWWRMSLYRMDIDWYYPVASSNL